VSLLELIKAKPDAKMEKNGSFYWCRKFIQNLNAAIAPIAFVESMPIAEYLPTHCKVYYLFAVASAGVLSTSCCPSMIGLHSGVIG